MKRLLATAAIATMLIAPAASFAQEHHEEHGAPPGGGHAAPAQAAPQRAQAPVQHVQGQPGGQQRFQGQPQQFRPQGAPAYQGQAQGQARSPGYAAPQAQGQQPYRAQAGAPRPQGYAGDPRTQAYRGAPGSGGFAAGRNGAPRAGGQPFSYNGRSFFRYRSQPYRYPDQYRGWENHGWRRGEWLPSIFINPYYFIDNYYDYSLWQPDYGYQWIRVGVDAVLINLATGQVADVVPGVYYY